MQSVHQSVDTGSCPGFLYKLGLEPDRQKKYSKKGCELGRRSVTCAVFQSHHPSEGLVIIPYLILLNLHFRTRKVLVPGSTTHQLFLHLGMVLNFSDSSISRDDNSICLIWVCVKIKV